MALFATGLFFCGVTACFSYLTQYAFYNDQRLGRKTQHQWWLLGAIAAAVLSLACFAIGSVCGVKAIT